MLIFSYIYRKLRKKCKITEVKQESNCISDNEIVKNDIKHKNGDMIILGQDEIIKNNIKHKICDMTILGEDEIDNIQKLSYISILELLLLIIRCNNYMIEYLINDENQK
jgi:hypothetical protein